MSFHIQSIFCLLKLDEQAADLSHHLSRIVNKKKIKAVQTILYISSYFTSILLDISDLNNEDFDELLIEQKAHVI